MINNYEYFILESLILESKISFQGNFLKILNNIQKRSPNPIVADLLEINSKELDLDPNYIGLTDKNDTISFISDKKMLSTPETYKITSSPLTYNDHRDMCRKMGVSEYDYTMFRNGDVGTVRNPMVYRYSGHDYPLIVFTRNDGKSCVMQVEHLQKLTTLTPSEMKVGRFVRKCLEVAGKKYSDSDIEKFVNTFKSEIDISKDVFYNFKIVKGVDIKNYYNMSMYSSVNRGSLGSSCMREDKCKDYFGIYVENPDKVSLVIYLDDNDKIKGRAILWDLDKPNIKFMDRIYTSEDSDVNLFIEYAKKNSWGYKKKQDYESNPIIISDGVEIQTGKDNALEINITNYTFDKYPYMDTMVYLKDGLLHNSSKMESNYWFKSTNGNGFVCNDCDNSQSRSCRGCDGDGYLRCRGCRGGKIDCDNCNGSGHIGYSSEECTKCVSGKLTCTKCNGDGRFTCTNCNGDGSTPCESCSNVKPIEL